MRVACYARRRGGGPKCTRVVGVRVWQPPCGVRGACARGVCMAQNGSVVCGKGSGVRWCSRSTRGARQAARAWYVGKRKCGIRWCVGGSGKGGGVCGTQRALNQREPANQARRHARNKPNRNVIQPTTRKQTQTCVKAIQTQNPNQPAIRNRNQPVTKTYVVNGT